MLPYILFVAALAALAASLYKDRKVERAEQSIARALRIHHVAQAMLAALALWNAVDTERSLREARIAQLDAEAAAVAAKHTAPVLEYYLHVFIPAAPAISGYFTYEKGLAEVPPQIVEKLSWDRVVSPEQRQEKDRGLKAFEELQRIARSILAEQFVYGERYPSELVKWATRTVEITEEQLPGLLNESPEAEAYANLLGRGIGLSIGKLREAQMRIEK